MAVRRESVELDLRSNVAAVAARDAVAIRLLNEEIKHLGGASSTGSKASRDLSRDIDNTGRSADRAAKSIDQYSGRLSLLARVSATLGPALIPIGAVGIPAITGLASSMGFAALGAGVMVGALQGVGDALKALNKAALEPTAANIDAANQAMRDLSPTAQEFTRQLAALEPQLKQLRDVGAESMLPGFSEGLASLERALPAVQAIVGAVGGELGQLGAEAGNALGGPRWQEFFKFLEGEAPRAIDDMAHGVGNLAHGFAELWMAFAPLNRSFSSFLLESTADFDKWAAGLSKTQGFTNFVNYIQQNGPLVGKALGAIANALVQIVEAAAPVGGPVLQALTAVANAIATIADSDLGTPIFGLAAAFSALNLAMKAGSGIQGRFVSFQNQTTMGFARQRSNLRDLTQQYRAYRQVSAFQMGKSDSFGGPVALAQANQFKTSLRSTAVEAGKAGATIGALGLVMTGAANKTGLANTAVLGLAGALAGPWGVAAGAALGLTIDLAHANDNVKVSLDAVDTALANQQWDKAAEGIRRVNAELDDANRRSGVKDFFSDFGKTLGAELPGGDTALDHGQVHLTDSAQKRLDAQKAAISAGKASEKLAAAQAREAATGRQVAASLLLASAGYRSYSTNSARAAKVAAEVRSEARKTASSFLTLGKDLNNSKVSLDSWINELRRQAQALQQFGENARKAADRGLRDGLIRQLQQAGPEGALRMKQLANGASTQIHRANQAFAAGQRAQQAYVAGFGRIPAKKETKVKLTGYEQAMAHAAQVAAALARIHDRNVAINIKRQQTGGGAYATAEADGGTVPKTGKPYADRHLYLLADGEEVISNRFGQADKHRELLKAINSGGLADGGTAGRAHRQSGESHLVAELRALRLAVSRDTARRDALAQKRSDVVSSVRGSFTSDPFASTGSVWSAGGGSNPLGALRADIAKARAFKTTLAALHKAGLSGDALASIASTGDLTAAQSLLSSGQAKDYGSLYAQRAAAANAVGQYAGSASYGAAQHVTNAHLARVEHELKVLRAQMAHQHKDSQKNHKGNAREFGKQINHSVGNGKRASRG